MAKTTRQVDKVNSTSIVESSLHQAALWEEVKGKLDQPAQGLSWASSKDCVLPGMAVEPEVILMDEPCSALDPVATLKIEDLMRTLAENYTIVIVTTICNRRRESLIWRRFS